MRLGVGAWKGVQFLVEGPVVYGTACVVRPSDHNEHVVLPPRCTYVCSILRRALLLCAVPPPGPAQPAHVPHDQQPL